MLTSPRRQNHTQAAFDPVYGHLQRPRDKGLIQFKLKLPCYLLDDSVAVRDFFGREDVLGEIDEHLLVKEGQDVMSELKTVALSGMGGIGMRTNGSAIIATDICRENLNRVSFRQESTGQV